MTAIGFNQTNTNQETNNIVKLNYTSAICYGKTGSGKTTGFILPNIQERIDQGHGLLVYDFKGNLHTQIKYLCFSSKFFRPKIIEVGKPWGESINILDYVDDKMLEQLYTNIYGEAAKDPYWKNATFMLFKGLYSSLKLISEIMEYSMHIYYYAPILEFPDKHNLDLTIKNISTYVANKSKLSTFLKDTESFLYETKRIIEEYQHFDEKSPSDIKANIETSFNELFQINNNLDQYKDVNTEDDTSGGKYAVIQVLSSVLTDVATNEYINHSQFDIIEALRSGKVVIVNVQGLSNNILNILNQAIYSRLQYKTINNNTPVTIFIDEAQKVLNENSMPDVDICRESKFEFIFATQDKLLLIQTLGELNTEVLLRNVVEQYSFSTQDHFSGTNKLKKFQYKNLITNTKQLAKTLFIDEDALFDAENKYQKINDIDDYANIDTDEKFIIEYTHDIHTNNKVKIRFENNESILVPYNKSANNIKYQQQQKELVRNFSYLENMKKKNKEKSPKY